MIPGTYFDWICLANQNLIHSLIEVAKILLQTDKQRNKQALYQFRVRLSLNFGWC